MKVEYLRRLRKCKAITTEINQAIKRATPGRGRGPWPQLSGESTPSTLLYCNNFHGSTWFRTDQYPVPAPSPQYGLGPPKGYTIIL